MAKLSMRDAAKHFDVSRPTLQKALKSGKISGVQDGKGHWTLDPAELARVYQPRKAQAEKVDNTIPANFTSENTPLQGEVEALRARLAEAEQRAAVAEALADERSRHIQDLRRMLPAPDNTPRPKGFFKRLLGQ
ncbi:helix-turn-helix domain-containing protein [Roseinatronobacter sp. S2]|uniref:helix-turn-helix domain-containing protein n=1 Tax=Roseinatronobacter sp. S2 TaxID=3035471 RepID=UPI002410A568|nr:helix-turn-helix domain-containing protein [Roseinatronobacter sp. S2]WFE76450.1 helix-turn-helix domain-containing protein [Roseinatronobacter sp. S2]WFE76455.1 helix-turn-helix domain-containing protein [Roseinatronobacter sp. S2]